MSLCQCQERPKCEWLHCAAYADWSVWQPRWGERAGRFKFMCSLHNKLYLDGVSKPMPGIDPPEGASEFWRPSLFDMIQLSEMEMSRQKAARSAHIELEDTPRIRQMTPGQRQTLIRLRTITASIEAKR